MIDKSGGTTLFEGISEVSQDEQYDPHQVTPLYPVATFKNLEEISHELMTPLHPLKPLKRSDASNSRDLSNIK